MWSALETLYLTDCLLLFHRNTLQKKEKNSIEENKFKIDASKLRRTDTYGDPRNFSTSLHVQKRQVGDGQWTDRCNVKNPNDAEPVGQATDFASKVNNSSHTIKITDLRRKLRCETN